MNHYYNFNNNLKKYRIILSKLFLFSMIEAKQPLVSVLVPIFHVEDFIERCARSIFSQTYKNLEFIFVDDATDDSTLIFYIEY